MKQHYLLQFSKLANVTPIFLDGIELRCNFTLAICAAVPSNEVKIQLTHGVMCIQVSRTLLQILSLSEEATERALIGAAMTHIVDAIDDGGVILDMKMRLVLDSRLMLENCRFGLTLPDEFVGVWFLVDI